MATRAAAASVLPARRELPWDLATSDPAFLLPPALISRPPSWTGWNRDVTPPAWPCGKRRWFEPAVLLADALQPCAIIHKDYTTTAEIDDL